MASEEFLHKLLPIIAPNYYYLMMGLVMVLMLLSVAYFNKSSEITPKVMSPYEKRDEFEENFDTFVGWFTRVSKEVVESKANPDLFQSQFMANKSNQDRVAFVMRDPQALEKIEALVAEMLPEEGKRAAKSARKASKLRAEGRKHYNRKEFLKALEKYNDAIVWAPDDSSDELSLCFANRSAALFELNRFRDTLLDIDEALARGYPQDKTPLLLIRKIKCLKILGEDKEAKDFADETRLYVKNNVKESTLKKEYLQGMQCLSVGRERESADPPTVDIKLKEPNERLYGANKSIRMGFDPEKGRKLEATRDIEEGEVILLEKPFVSWLAPNYYTDYCHHCNAQLKGRIIPCFHCSLVRFCSSYCWEESWQQYHGKECPFLETLQNLSSGHLALRMVLIAGVAEALKVDKEPSIPFKEWPKYEFKKDYKSIASLSIQSECYGFDRLLYYSVAAAVFTLFAEKMSIIKSTEKTAFGGLMLKQLFQIKHNLFRIYDQDIRPTKLKGLYIKSASDLKAIAVGLYRTSSLVNHSCSPNARHSYLGSSIVFIATRDIKSGQEVCTTYGPTVENTIFKERQRYIKNTYRFDCRCVACSNQEECWPYFRCPSCDGNLVPKPDDMTDNECLGCGKKDQNMSRLMSDYANVETILNEGITLFNRRSLGMAESLLLEAQELSNKVLQKNCPQHIQVKVSLSNLYHFKQNFDLAIKYRKEALELEKTFSGENSCEVLEHLAKLGTFFGQKSESKRVKKEERAFALIQKKKYFERTCKLFVKLNNMEFKVLTSDEIQVYSDINDVYSQNSSHAIFA